MKKYTAIVLILTSALFIACDVISEGDRIIEMDEIVPLKNVLLVDFTDQTCINCPDAAVEVETMKEAYGDALVVVSMHASGRNLPLVTPEGNTYEEHFKVSAHPSGLIDGIKLSSNYQAWNGLTVERYNIESDIKIALAAQYSAETRELNLTTTIEAESDYTGIKLLLWLTESGIVERQAMIDGSLNPEYVHNHVFRSSINGTWGEDCPLADKSLKLQHQYTLSEDWNAENVSIVGFIYKSSSNEVLNVVEIHLSKV